MSLGWECASFLHIKPASPIRLMVACAVLPELTFDWLFAASWISRLWIQASICISGRNNDDGSDTPLLNYGQDVVNKMLLEEVQLYLKSVLS